MRKRGGAFTIALAGLFALFGTKITVSQGVAVAASVSDALPATEQLILASGEKVPFAFRSALSSQKSKRDGSVEFIAVRDVKADGLTVIAAGAIGHGKIAAIKRRGHRGKPGRLKVEFATVPSVNGALIRLTGEHQVSGEDRSQQVKDNAAQVVLQGMGFGAMLIPIVLLERGGSAEIEAGTRFDAAVANDVLLEKASIEQNQPIAPSDKATIFIIHGYYVTCGSLLLIPAGESSNVVRIEIPAGRYWFHAGVQRNAVREIANGVLYGFTLGAIDVFGYPSAKKMLKRPVDEFFPLDAKNGMTYYITGEFPGDHQVKVRIRPTGAEDGEAALASTYNHFFYLRDLSPKVLHLLKAEPKGIENWRDEKLIVGTTGFSPPATADRPNSANTENPKLR